MRRLLWGVLSHTGSVFYHRPGSFVPVTLEMENLLIINHLMEKSLLCKAASHPIYFQLHQYKCGNTHHFRCHMSDLKCVHVARNLEALRCFLTGGAHRESPELPQPQVCQEVCHRLLLWNSAEAEVWHLRHWQQNRWPEWRRLLGAARGHLGPGIPLICWKDTPVFTSALRLPTRMRSSLLS